jgi:hypothetical protein
MGGGAGEVGSGLTHGKFFDLVMNGSYLDSAISAS